MPSPSLIATFLAGLTLSHALHHMKHPAVHTVNQRDSELTLRVTNKCSDNIHPALLTQSGTPPNTSGFPLTSGTSRDLTVSADWQGRIWGRTNCTFDQNGKPQSGQGERVCTTGDCGQFLQCQGAVSQHSFEDTVTDLEPGSCTSNVGRIHHAGFTGPYLL